MLLLLLVKDKVKQKKTAQQSPQLGVLGLGSVVEVVVAGRRPLVSQEFGGQRLRTCQ